MKKADYLRVHIETWFSRASMAYYQKEMTLSTQALGKMWQYQVYLADLEGTTRPPYPPEPEVFFSGTDFDQNGNNSAPVPRRPYPGSNPTEKILQLPNEDDCDT